ncbi:MAG: LysE family translocator [Rhizobiaceae bacterium]
MDYLPDAATFAQFAVATAILALTPGPDMTLFVGRALSEGRAAGFACMAGAFTGIVVHTLLVALGLSALIVAAPSAFLALKIVGALYLVWLAVQAVTRGSAFSPDTKKRKARPLVRNWLAGVGINLLNPKIVLFFMTFLPQFVSASDPHAPEKLVVLGFAFIVLSIPLTVPLILAADRFAAALKRNPGVIRVLDWMFAGIFSAFAAKILLTQTR